MDPSRRLRRRRFVGALVTSLTASVWPMGCRDDARDPRDEHLRGVLRAYFQLDANPQVREVGEPAGLASEPEDTERARAIVEAHPSVPDAVEALEAELVVDFEQGDMRSVAGWQLARLEVELLTLVVDTGV